MTAAWRFCQGVLTAVVMAVLLLAALIPVVALILLKVLAPTRRLKSAVTGLLNGFCEWWVECCRCSYVIIHRPTWLAKLPADLSTHKSYLVICNHLSWTDIPVLVFSLNRRVPFFKFFMKKILVTLPVLGWGAWALDFPLLNRYSREKLATHPELRNRDADTLARFCARLRKRPGSIIIFVEGTRLTPEKHAIQQSPYKYLLRPKTGGVAIVLQNLGEEISEYLDATIVYSKTRGVFWDFFCGGEAIQLTIDCHPVPRELAKSSCERTDAAREGIKAWLEQIWRDKDRQISELKQRGSRLEVGLQHREN